MRIPTFLRGAAALAALTVAALSPVSAVPAVAAEGDTTTINILGITDLHGHIETTKDEPGAATIACVVEAARAADRSTLFVSNGDNVGGSAYISSILDDDPTIDVLNAMGLDVTSAGNHEFDQGIDDLANDLIPSFDAPILAANVTGNDALTAEGDGDGVWITEVHGIKVAFVGVVTDELPSLTAASGLVGLKIANATEVANARATALKKSGAADVVVALAHEDAAIFGSQFNGDVDAVVAGHTHVPYAAVVPSTDGSPVAVVQPDHYGLLLGELRLTVTEKADGSYDVTASTARNIDLATSGCDVASSPLAARVGAIVEQAKIDSDAAGADVLADLATDYLRGTNNGTDYGANRGTESTASNLIADSFQHWVTHDIQVAGDHYIGLMNAGGVRADYQAGPLTVGEAYTVQPFGNEIGYATYTGAQVRTLLAQQWQPTTSRSTLMLGVSSNVKVYINQEAADALEDYWDQIKNKGVPAASLADAIAQAQAQVINAVYIDGKRLADEASVVIASNSFLLRGGDNFTVLGESTLVNTGILDRTVTGAYLAGLENTTAPLTKRQIGVAGSLDAATGTATVRLTGLTFSATSEQGVRDAAASVEARVAMADGSTRVVATSRVDTTVTPALPESGRASLVFTVPEGAATEACAFDGEDRTCARFTFYVLDASGAERELDYTYLVSTGAPSKPGQEPGQPTASASQGAGSVEAVGPTSPAKKNPLASTGVSIGIGVVALGLLVAGGLLLARRRAGSGGASDGGGSGESAAESTGGGADL